MRRASFWRRGLLAARDNLSFSRKVEDLVGTLNQEIDFPDRTEPLHHSHPSGYVREISKRRLNIAQAYLTLVKTQGVENWEKRLYALKALMYAAWNAKTLSMPINTARVQIQLMKECVQARGRKRRQMELMEDFSQASHGREPIIRRLLREHCLVEIPEDGGTLRELGFAWDDHVHDSLSQGRKTPCQLLLDAFIKGMGRVSLAYYDFDDERVFREALEAGDLLGIKVDLGIEFSVGPKGRRLHFMYVLPSGDNYDSALKFLESRREVLAPFRAGLTENATRRRDVLSSMLEAFNTEHLPVINSRFRNLSYLQMQKVTWDDLVTAIHGGQASQIHLAQVIADNLKSVLYKRAIYLRNQLDHSQNGLTAGLVSSWEVEKLRGDYHAAIEEYRDCHAHSVHQKYVIANALDYDSAFVSLDDLAPVFSSAGGTLAFIHPLSQGTHEAVSCLLKHHMLISAVEVFNMSNSQVQDPADLQRLGVLVDLLNRGLQEDAERLLDSWNMNGEYSRELLMQACGHYARAPLVPRCGSDYVGKTPWLPGMGFASAETIGERNCHMLASRGCTTLPQSVADCLFNWSPELSRPAAAPAQASEEKCGHRIWVVSKPVVPETDPIEDEALEDLGGPARFWRYLNPTLKGTLKILVGFVPALLIVGPWYASLWLGITGFRNIMADMISAGGLRVRNWRLHVIDRQNVSVSMFWTGFSVPILTAAKMGFDHAWGLGGLPTQGLLFALAKFWVIAFTNGLYISSHNRLRGFPNRVIRANFFRTVLSWPLATAGSFVLDGFGIPAIVQAKIWSDVVAGLIEGGNKFLMRLKLRQRDLLLSVQRLQSGAPSEHYLDMLDLLYIWGVRDMGRRALRRVIERGSAGLGYLPGNPFLGGPVKQGPREIWGRLYELFSTSGSMEGMTGAVLQAYSGRKAYALASIVARLHEPFVVWLKKNRPSGTVGKSVPTGTSS